MLFKARGDGPKMLEFVEEALDQVSIPVEEGAEGGDPHPAGHGFDVGPGALVVQRLAQGVAVIGPISKQNLPRPELSQHVLRALAVVGLSFAELERDWQAMSVDKGMDFGGQSASRAPHASGSRLVPSGNLRVPFLTLAAC